MTLSDLYIKYRGSQVDWDATAGAQCVDWAKMFLQLCLGIKTQGKGTSPWGNAVDYWYDTPKAVKAKCGKLDYTGDDFQFLRGDIVIWNTGKYGHIAVATGEQDEHTFYTYDQNYGKDKAIRQVCHNRSNTILGVLRPYRRVKWDVNIRTRPSLSGTVVGEKKQGSTVLPLNLQITFDTVAKWYRIGKGQYIAYNSLEVI